ncbi:MAG: hypothetical protein PHS16_00540 [Candidatus Colwellbacteria bacterium]|jgi:hypothetical protein|nr:hypothetical protein [Candidatus Colwellbacteria bacterium]MCK9497776.1 hypothetical protein [Candidatus Colwellbacteria bacterium]MDD3752421.1 hypothetical protein [Candidatus Colwellbacteria bacterium]MDD4819089.1 hypothetical protein [Candidatus Colwellbacteria bacterium]
MGLWIACLVGMALLIAAGYISLNYHQKARLGKKGFRTHLFAPIILTKTAIKNGNDRTTLISAAEFLGDKWLYNLMSYPWLAEIKYRSKKGEISIFFPRQSKDDPAGVLIFYKNLGIRERNDIISKLIDVLCLDY